MHSCLQVDGTVLKQGLWRLRWPTAIFDTLHLCKRSSRLREAFSVWHIAYRLYAIFKLCVLCATVLGDVTLFFFVKLPFCPFCATSRLQIATVRRPICKQPLIAQETYWCSLPRHLGMCRTSHLPTNTVTTRLGCSSIPQQEYLVLLPGWAKTSWLNVSVCTSSVHWRSHTLTKTRLNFSINIEFLLTF